MSLPCSQNWTLVLFHNVAGVWLFILALEKIKKDSYISLLKWSRDGPVSASLMWGIVIHFKMSNLWLNVKFAEANGIEL